MKIRIVYEDEILLRMRLDCFRAAYLNLNYVLTRNRDTTPEILNSDLELFSLPQANATYPSFLFLLRYKRKKNVFQELIQTDSNGYSLRLCSLEDDSIFSSLAFPSSSQSSFSNAKRRRSQPDCLSPLRVEEEENVGREEKMMDARETKITAGGENEFGGACTS
ncbi:hypothetical protein V9T40_013767 [Parthenolecanium corni]|uniref:Uncharacterized protein n=1 Tax=Parthenolecanium corni TaxID=536013 RepID=A0AAN9TFF6_9HEMI